MNAKKIVTAGLALVMVAGISVAGTLAYLTAESQEKINKFTVGGISIELTEPEWSYGDAGAKIVPGDMVDKDPTVTVQADSENCFVYVGIKNDLKLDDGTVAGDLNIDTSAWTVVGTTSDGTVVYRYIGEKAPDGYVPLATSNTELEKVFTTVTISGTAVNEDNIQQLANDTITVQAYAYQADNVEMTNADAAALAFFAPAEP